MELQNELKKAYQSYENPVLSDIVSRKIDGEQTVTTTADDVWRLLAELTAAQKETERLLREQSQEMERLFREQSKETERLFREQNQETDRRIREVNKEIRQVNKQIDGSPEMPQGVRWCVTSLTHPTKAAIALLDNTST